MIDSDKICVALAPHDNPQVDTVNSVAAIINKSAYDTRLLITGVIPKIVAYYNDIDMAEQAAGRLKLLGLSSYVFRESELRKPSQTFTVHALEIKENALNVWTRDGLLKTVPQDNLYLILSGKKEKAIQSEKTVTRSKINLTATLLTGMPVTKKVRNTEKVVNMETENFMRIYEHESMYNSIEFLQYGLDYSFLGAEMGSSSSVNFAALARKLKNAFPQAVYDERLMKYLPADRSSEFARDNVEVNCRLIYMYYKAVENNKSYS